MTDLLLLIIFIILSALFAAIEVATVSITKGKVRSLVEQKRNGAKALQAIKENPNRMLVTILIANNLVNIAAASVTTAAAIDLFGDAGVGVATGLVTLLVLVFGDITPKTFALQNSERLALFFARPLQILQTILWPAVTLFAFIANFVNRISGTKENRLTEEELRSVIDIGQEEGLLDKEATKRLQSVLDFETTTVKKIMTPKAQVMTFAADITVEEFLDAVLDAPFDRYPLYENSGSNIVGVLDVIDVIRAVKEGKTQVKLREIMRKTFFVRQNARLDSLLQEFRQKRTSLGIVVDDKNEMVGIFSSQDIVEEIVGDIFEGEVYKNHLENNG